jgi:hypothetical protein
MNLLIHDLACAIERDATDTPDRDQRGDGRAAWIAEWQVRIEDEPVEPHRRLRPREQ